MKVQAAKDCRTESASFSHKGWFSVFCAKGEIRGSV